MIGETCPLCGGRGTKRKGDGAFTRKTPPRLACIACDGDGTIPRWRLQAIVRRGVLTGRRR